MTETRPTFEEFRAAAKTDPQIPIVHAALSGGLHSTAMVLGLYEKREEFIPFYIDTGNMHPSMGPHLDAIERKIDQRIIKIAPPTLEERIYKRRALPGTRQLWCRHDLKIKPLTEYVSDLHAVTENFKIAFGAGLDYNSQPGRYPLMEWCWNDHECELVLYRHGIKLPLYTDCMWCPRQSLTEWRALWDNNPDAFALAEKWEKEIGYTFRSPTADKTQPCKLSELREQFEQGYIPWKGYRKVVGRRGCSC